MSNVSTMGFMAMQYVETLDGGGEGEVVEESRRRAIIVVWHLTVKSARRRGGFVTTLEASFSTNWPWRCLGRVQKIISFYVSGLSVDSLRWMMVRWARRRNERETLLLMFHFPVVFFLLKVLHFVLVFYLFSIFLYFESRFSYLPRSNFLALLFFSLWPSVLQREPQSFLRFRDIDTIVFCLSEEANTKGRSALRTLHKNLCFTILFLFIAFRTVCVCVRLRYIDVTTRSSSNDHLGELVREPHVLSDLIQHWISIATSISSFFLQVSLVCTKQLLELFYFIFWGGGGGRGWVVVSASFPTNVLVGQCGDDCARNSLWCVDSCRCDLSHSSTITRVQNPFGNEMREKRECLFFFLFLNLLLMEHSNIC